MEARIGMSLIDNIKEFAADVVIEGTEEVIYTKTVYEAYILWMIKIGNVDNAWNLPVFSHAMKNLGYEKVTIHPYHPSHANFNHGFNYGTKTFYVGISLEEGYRLPLDPALRDTMISNLSIPHVESAIGYEIEERENGAASLDETIKRGHKIKWS